MNDLYRKLVDLYAGQELPEELAHDLESAAATDDKLAKDMATLTQTVDFLKAHPAPEFDERDFLRILFRMQTMGADIPFEETQSHPGQYRLPM